MFVNDLQMDLEECIARATLEELEKESEERKEELRSRGNEQIWNADVLIELFEQGIEIGKQMMKHEQNEVVRHPRTSPSPLRSARETKERQ